MKYKIMIVDDEPVNLRTLERVFRQHYHVVTAESGAEALSLLEQHDVALMISDQRMPEMTGIELMKRTVTLRPQMVKILLTGYTDVSALIEAINCGLVYRYLTKPWNNDDLRLTVTRALEHFDMLKSKHLMGMDNQRLRARLTEISELASQGVEQESAAPNEDSNEEEESASQHEVVYELMG
jgi:YesN/AraC family two-component response regulator